MNKQLDLLPKSSGSLTKQDLEPLKDQVLKLIYEQEQLFTVKKVMDGFFEVRINLGNGDKPFLNWTKAMGFKCSSLFKNLNEEYLKAYSKALTQNPRICKDLGIEVSVEATTEATTEDYEKSIAKGFVLSKTNGATSSAKVKEIHGLFSKSLSHLMGLGVKIFSAGFYPYYNKSGSEKTVEAYPKTKKVDIVTEENDQVITATSVKFPCSNYEQNSYNYFDSLVGESTRLKNRDPERIISHILIVRSKTPYFEKDGTVKNVESLSFESLKDYELLISPPPKNPTALPVLDLLCLQVVDISTKSGLLPEQDAEFLSAIDAIKKEKDEAKSAELVAKAVELLVVKTQTPTNPSKSDKICYNLESFAKTLARSHKSKA